MSAATRESLIAFLLETGRVSAADLVPDAQLITSGLIDSTTLFGLALWIEQVVGHPVDITRLDLPAEWDTVERIVRFVERSRAGGMSSTPG